MKERQSDNQLGTRWTIRQARESDAEEISALITSLSRYFLPDPRSPEVGSFLETLTPEATAERIRSDSYGCFVAEDEHGISGFIAIRDKTHVYHLFVASRMHRKGTARALWDHIRSRSGAQVFTVNSSLFAVPVYERLGFRVVDEMQRVDGLVFVPMEFRHQE